MKVLILAGGLGTRLGEETRTCPKPMVMVGPRPILWHIMKGYAHYGHTEFVILLGYMGYYIKEYFANYALHHSNVTFDLANASMHVHSNASEDWKVTLFDTGEGTMTGGRLLRARELTEEKTFLLTYGDGVADINLNDLVRCHRESRATVTMTAVQPEGRYGSLELDGRGRVAKFTEKPPGESGWVNGGFFVCEPQVFDYLTEGDATTFERAPLERMAKDGGLYSYRHGGFWKCMDTLRDKNALNELWDSGKAPWKVWER